MLVGLLLGPITPVIADECDQLPPPVVTLKRLETPLSTNLRYGYRTLTAIGVGSVPAGRSVLGLTRGESVIQIETKLPSFINRQSGYECASPQLTISYGFKPLTLYVAREFPAGSCAYQEIHAHEMRHVETYQAHLAAIENEMAATLQRRFATGTPWRAPSGEIRRRLQQELDNRWLPYIRREIERVNSAQALIDTPEEYARVADSCGGEIRKILR